MRLQKKIIFISSITGMISMFLPWFQFKILGFTQNLNGLHSWGIVVFACFIISGMLIFPEDKTKDLKNFFGYSTLFLGGLATLLLIIAFFKTLGNGAGFLRIGFYLALLSAAGIVLSACFLRNPSETSKDEPKT